MLGWKKFFIKWDFTSERQRKKLVWIEKKRSNGVKKFTPIKVAVFCECHNRHLILAEQKVKMIYIRPGFYETETSLAQPRLENT